MCGITGGVWSCPEQAIERHTLDRMTDRLIHRGPDDRGIYYRDFSSATSSSSDRPALGVGLGFRRLSIIDVAGGHQPLSNEDGTIQLVFNGEIYNYRSLRRRLEGAGHRFTTESDSETIVHLYEDLGVECFSHLNGMFAIALWDSRHQRLVLARDRMGKKPLYFTLRDRQFAFASELKSLMCLAKSPPAIDPTAIDLYFTYQYIPHPWTIYQGIQKLAPGAYGVFEHGRWSTEKFWKIDWSEEIPRTPRQAIEELRELLIDAVRLRLRSDVPLGAFLSGGVDSSLITAIAQRELNHPIKTFSIGFSDSDFDETHFARQVAESLKTEHHRFEVTPDALSVMDRLIEHYDEPFCDSSALPTWYLCRETRKHVTVALSGDGGDELFAGYDRYRALQWSERFQLPWPLPGLLKHGTKSCLPSSSHRRSWMRRVQRYAEALDQPPMRRYLRWLQIFDESTRWSLYRDGFLEQLPPFDPTQFLRQAWDQAGSRDVIAHASIADMQTYLPCDLMTKVDIASMAHSLEARQPFLDYRLVEFAASLPTPLKYRWGRGKRILADAFQDWIPPGIWKRPKMGFGVPLGNWFRGPLGTMFEAQVLAPDARSHAYLQPQAIRDLFNRHQKRLGEEGYRLWSLLVFELWLRRWGDPS